MKFRVNADDFAIGVVLASTGVAFKFGLWVGVITLGVGVMLSSIRITRE